MIRALMRGVVLVAVLATTAQPAVVGLRSQASGEGSSIGTLSKYDVKSRVLTVQTASSANSFVLAEKASVYLGSRVLRDEEIASHVGARAKVRFTESGGKRVATSVMLSPKA